MENETVIYCTFCGKSQKQVMALIAGPSGNFICDECVDLCFEIVEEKRAIVHLNRAGIREYESWFDLIEAEGTFAVSLKCTTSHTFEYEAVGKDDPGFVECRIHFDYTPGSPESGRYGAPENYDPGGGCEIAYDYAEREVTNAYGKKSFETLMRGEWLDEHCREWLEKQDESDLENDLPDNRPDPDRMREDREDRRQMERE